MNNILQSTNGFAFSQFRCMKQEKFILSYESTEKILISRSSVYDK